MLWHQQYGRVILIRYSPDSGVKLEWRMQMVKGVFHQEQLDNNAAASKLCEEESYNVRDE